jgi:hypothetical protein
MKSLFAVLALLVSTQAHAFEGSWFSAGASFEHLANGADVNGFGTKLEGGYWYLGNVAYGGYAKGSFFSRASTNIYDLGVFWRAASEAGLFGQLTAGVAFVSPATGAPGLRTGNTTSLSLGLEGGFLFPISESFSFGPEVHYRHLTAGAGADQIGAGLQAALAF